MAWKTAVITILCITFFIGRLGLEAYRFNHIEVGMQVRIINGAYPGCIGTILSLEPPMGYRVKLSACPRAGEDNLEILTFKSSIYLME